MSAHSHFELLLLLLIVAVALEALAVRLRLSRASAARQCASVSMRAACTSRGTAHKEEDVCDGREE
jgi:hypothetical protein